MEIGNKKVREHGLDLAAVQSTRTALDAQVLFMGPAEFQRAEVDIPDAIDVADHYPLSVRRFAPAIQRMQRTVV